MGVYYGYQMFKKMNGRIEITYLMGIQGMIKQDELGYLICIHEKDSLEEKVKTLIHEFLHLSFENMRYFNVSLSKQRNPEFLATEERLEKEAAEIYECQPVLVKHLKKKILESKHVPLKFS